MMSKLSTEGQFRVIRAQNNGELRFAKDLDRMVAAIAEQESQVGMFGEAEAPVVTEAQRRAAREVTLELERAIAALRRAEALLAESTADPDMASALAEEARKVAGKVADAAHVQRARQLAMVA